MVSIEEALKSVIENSRELSREVTLPVENSQNEILFRDVLSPINMPPFRQAAMDGYALNLCEDESYSLIAEVKAGDHHQPVLSKGEALRIFTGAPVPNSANVVVMQEKVKVQDEVIIVENEAVPGENIRPIGEQVKKGEVALKRGTKLTPAAIGYLSSLGITEVAVNKKPSVAIVTTGNELIEAGKSLTFGKIYESNSVMLKSALLDLGFRDVRVYKIQDNFNETYNSLKNIIAENGVVIISGGISVGDYDFVGKTLRELDIEQIFYKVNQKPGKPLFFGKNENTLLFALPGNPAAALTCFYIYVYASLQKMTGQDKALMKVMAESKSYFIKNGDRPQFLKALYKDGGVSILEGQSSAMLQTFAVANALIKMPGEWTEIRVGDIVEVILLPF
ncbi:molybdopterin molybdochelatase [Salinimicrobium sediminis]|uniref:Molybdopterin molybdenumtransferase n=1 Tax=Salinimicrobium sediminis TaxID=1343891 RepID=A0A285X2Q7_9FLAO|nr:gephyrin-like molybdotransferase Glp [Salinimicrobium sediminis]SOC79306.1 molybdopterin molybdochelatase [Salinimicrobium sediminis]